MMRVLIAATAALVLALPAGAAPADLLPKSGTATDWPLRAEPRSYDRATLYEYIDGAADLFLAYGFESLAHGEYRARGEYSGGVAREQKLVTVDVYDMGAPVRAFGIFASERPAAATFLPAGQQGYVGDGLGAFWVDRYYVKVSAVEGASDADVVLLAEATARVLPPGTGMPPELKRLPTTGRIAGTEGYVHQSALGHRFLQRVVSARYRAGKATAELHVADLGTAATAAQGARKLRDFEAKTGARPVPVKAVGEEGFSVLDASLGQCVAARTGRFLVIAFGEKATRTALVALVKTTVAGLK